VKFLGQQKSQGPWNLTMDDEELFLAGLASGLDLPTAAAMSADDGDGDDDGSDNNDDNKQTGCGCLGVLMIGVLIGSLAGLSNT